MDSHKLKDYIGKPPAKLLGDYEGREVRILFPGTEYTQTHKQGRINVVVVDGLIVKVWLG
jgi:hypothetical protein